MALALWAMTTLVAPVVGPLLGGWITDNVSWPWIFYINVPVGLIAAVFIWSIYRKRDTPIKKLPIDTVGLSLLVIWVAAMQIMLDKGKELDWFHSGQIQLLAVVALVGFLFFVAWELTDEHPVVDLRLFARRNFAFGAVTLSIAYGLFFGNVVLLPLWLQQWMGYTATDAGMALAPVGILAIILSPVAGKNVAKWDPRVMATGAFNTQGRHPGDADQSPRLRQRIDLAFQAAGTAIAAVHRGMGDRHADGAGVRGRGYPAVAGPLGLGAGPRWRGLTAGGGGWGGRRVGRRVRPDDRARRLGRGAEEQAAEAVEGRALRLQLGREERERVQRGLQLRVVGATQRAALVRSTIAASSATGSSRGGGPAGVRRERLRSSSSSGPESPGRADSPGRP